jgi:hypothetical protein
VADILLPTPELSSTSATSFSQQQLTTAGPQQLSDQLTNSPINLLTSLNCPAYNILAWLLSSNNCCTVAYFDVVAYQQVYLPQYQHGLAHSSTLKEITINQNMKTFSLPNISYKHLSAELNNRQLMKYA